MYTHVHVLTLADTSPTPNPHSIYIYKTRYRDAVDIRGLKNVLIGVGAGEVCHDELKALFYEIDDGNRGYITWRQLSDCLFGNTRKTSVRSLPHIGIAPPSPTRKKGVLRSPTRKKGVLRSPIHKKMKTGTNDNLEQLRDICLGGVESNFASRARPMPFGDECAAGRAELNKVKLPS